VVSELTETGKTSPLGTSCKVRIKSYLFYVISDISGMAEPPNLLLPVSDLSSRNRCSLRVVGDTFSMSRFFSTSIKLTSQLMLSRNGCQQMAGYGLTSGIRSLEGPGVVLLATASRPVLGPSLICNGYREFFPWSRATGAPPHSHSPMPPRHGS
jgi:hypothetical protein